MGASSVIDLILVEAAHWRAMTSVESGFLANSD
jgi:hypothetical protein